ncbi:protein of unknown function [Candidatus Hydrogenisulfobacillus filiaventi]|uniref:Stage III sporulation protein AG n=1 Tax=Candidatus Hydrogenisulfobacillus filiaventi TaxID=2707344 RepID=A0A6F8ZFZ5_9FIRM|nr:protein of unknown function [Candidatus Hydrogenisulfobacillus filiaventi]
MAWPAGRGPPGSGAPARTAAGTLAGEEAAVSARLAAILARIPGAGRVHVAVTLSRTATDQYLGESGGSGGNGPLVVSTPSGGQQPVRLDELAPVVQGVVVVASGATRPLVRQELAQAVETLLNLAPYQVLILPEGL